MPTSRAGALCLKGCTADADCRSDEGYVCDPQWHACFLPNAAVIVPRSCPAAAGVARDQAFVPVPGEASPAAVIDEAGALIGPPLGQDGPARSTPRLARDRKGILFAVWLEIAERHRTITLARSRDGGRTWTAPSMVATADCTARDPDCLELDALVLGAATPQPGTDKIHVIYTEGGGVRVATSFDEGASFRAAVTGVPGQRGAAAIGKDGELHLVVLDAGTSLPGFGSADHQVRYTSSRDGGQTFTKAQVLSGRDEVLPFWFAIPSVAVDPRRGWIYAAYVRGGRDAVWDLVLLASKDKGKTWRRTRIGDAPACAIHMVPTLAVDGTTGTLHAAWYDNRGGGPAPGRFAHAACTAGLARCTEQGAINTTPFAGLTTARSGPAALGETAALLIDDRRHTLHAVWTQPVDDGGHLMARTFHASAKLPATVSRRR